MLLASPLDPPATREIPFPWPSPEAWLSLALVIAAFHVLIFLDWYLGKKVPRLKYAVLFTALAVVPFVCDIYLLITLGAAWEGYAVLTVFAGTYFTPAVLSLRTGRKKESFAESSAYSVLGFMIFGTIFFVLKLLEGLALST